MEMVSELNAAAQQGANHVLLVPTDKGWQASIGKKGSSGYTVAIHSEPGLALFMALQQAGMTDGPSWQHPDPFVRWRNARDQLTLALWGAAS